MSDRKLHDDDILQIMPATGWWVRYRGRQGEEEEEEEEEVYPLVAWGVRRDGSVVALDVTTDDAVVDEISVGANFLRLEYKGDDPPAPRCVRPQEGAKKK